MKSENLKKEILDKEIKSFCGHIFENTKESSTDWTAIRCGNCFKTLYEIIIDDRKETLQKSKQKLLEIIEELKTDLMNEGKRLAKIEDKRKKGEWIGKHEGSLTIGINVMRILDKYQKRIEEEL